MAIHRFFDADISPNADIAVLKGENAKHANVLHIRIGEQIIICDGCKNDYLCEVVEKTKDVVLARVLSNSINSIEKNPRITLFQGLVKDSVLEEVIQKAVELGIYEIIPVVCEYSISKTYRKALKLSDSSKSGRLERISESAAKQSQRGIIPKVCNFSSFDDAVEKAKKLDLAYACHVGENIISCKAFLRKANLQNIETLGIFIGVEGGFSPNEIQIFKRNGIATVSLGKSILRLETAAVAAIANLQYELL